MQAFSEQNNTTSIQVNFLPKHEKYRSHNAVYGVPALSCLQQHCGAGGRNNDQSMRKSAHGQFLRMREYCNLSPHQSAMSKRKPPVSQEFVDDSDDPEDTGVNT